jgi:hypothetical protein
VTVDPRPCPVCDGDGLRLRTRPVSFDEIARTLGPCMAAAVSQGALSLHMLRCDPCDGNGWVSP